MNSQSSNTKNIYYPPGGILIWIIVFIELITFMIALITFVTQLNNDGETFQESQQLLNKTFGLMNTVFLVTAGFFMAEAVRKLKHGDGKSSYNRLMVVMLFGLAFLVLKGYEYYEKINHGIGLEYSEFFTYYWMLTGFHFIHVLVGLIILLVLSHYIRTGHYQETNYEDVETGGIFWHMCDLIWLVLFPILYLL